MDSDKKAAQRFEQALGEPVAGNGLLHRRAFLHGGVAFTGLAAAALTANDALAQAAAPAAGGKPPLSARTLMTQSTPGAPFSTYGTPSRYEVSTGRDFTFNAAAPGTGSSRTPHHLLDGTITPSGLHFQRNHNGVPTISPEDHTLLIHGMVKRPLTFTMDALMRYPTETHVRFVECAGNNGGFGAALPRQANAGAMHGLLSCSEWTGIPLKILLDEAGVDVTKAKWLLAEGADAASMSRSVPIEKAMGDAMIALYQNGERIRPEQGYPMRLLLPGFEGNQNVKWLHRLKVSATPTFTKDETSKYTELLPGGKAAQFMFAQPVNSFISRPSFGYDMQGPGLYQITGLAWSGNGKIAKVEVSADGKSWAQAALTEPVLPMSLTRFRLWWKWDGGPATLTSRATDEKKNVQPTRTAWLKAYGANQGYKFNGITAWATNELGNVSHVYV